MRYADDGVEVYYAFPGALDVRVAPGAARPTTHKYQEVVLGMLMADPDEQDPLEEGAWRWPAHTHPATRHWAQHVLAADHRNESLVYEHAGELVLVYAAIPPRAHELELLELGFTPALATWRAPATAETRTLAARLAQQGRPAARPSLGAAAPQTSLAAQDPAGAVEHAWMRWAASLDTYMLRVGQRSYDFRAPPRRDGSALVLRYRARGDALRFTLDVARHPLIYDVTIEVERAKSRSAHTIQGVAWEDFPALIEEVERIVAGKPTAPTLVPAAANQAPVAQSEAMEGPYRRADVWETVLASVLFSFDLPESLPLYPLARRLTAAALAVLDEQASLHGGDYLASLRRADTMQVARLAQLERRLFGVLTEAEPLGALREMVRHVLGLADGSIRRPPAGGASEAFWRTWSAPGALIVRGHTFTLARHQVLLESTTVELCYRYPSVTRPAPTLRLSVGLPDRHGRCELRATLNLGGLEQSAPWTLSVPQLGQLTGAAIVQQLRPVNPPAPTDDQDQSWEDALVAAFADQDARDPQLRLERRLGSGARIFVLIMPGSRPEQIVGRVELSAELEIEAMDLSSMSTAAQALQHRRLEAALALVRARFVPGTAQVPPDYASARKKALAGPPEPALLDRLARHLAGQREAAAIQEMRAQARADLGAAARTILALAIPEGPSPGETAEWLDDQRLPKSAALLSSYIFTPTLALDAFMADLSASLDAELGTRPAKWQPDGTLKILRTTLLGGQEGHHVLEAAGTGVRRHPVTVRREDDRIAYVDAGDLAKSADLRVYLAEDFSEETIHAVWARHDALLQSLLRAPVQLEELRQLILVAAELVDAPNCQGAAQTKALRALEAARAAYADARTQLLRGRDARALDRMRTALRAIVESAHRSAEHCAAGQAALPDPGIAPASHP